MSLCGKPVEILDGESNCLGNGFYGTVYKATWNGKTCVAKMLRTSTKYSNVEMNKDSIENNKELEKLRYLALHENIVTIHGAYLDQKMCYLVMDYVNGETFYSYLFDTQSKMSTTRLQNLILQFAKGMEHLHSNEILHRNLSTRCLLLNDKYSKLKICMDLTDSSGVPISIYTAPEVIKLNNYKIMSDVYSFGIILWEVMARLHPSNLNLDEESICFLTLKGIRPNLELVKPMKLKSFYQKLMEMCWHADGEKRPSMKVLANWLSYVWATEKLSWE